MAFIYKSEKFTGCRDRLCKADYAQVHDCLILGAVNRDAESAALFREYQHWHPAEARIHIKEFEHDQKAAMKANRQVEKVTVKAAKTPKQQPPAEPQQPPESPLAGYASAAIDRYKLRTEIEMLIEDQGGSDPLWREWARTWDGRS